MKKTVRDLKAGDILEGSGFVVSHAWPSRMSGQWMVEGRYPNDTDNFLHRWNAKTTVKVLDKA